MMGFESDDKELDISLSHDPDGAFVARVIHRPTGTIKISDSFETQEEAVADALNGLAELVEARRKGLGSN